MVLLVTELRTSSTFANSHRIQEMNTLFGDSPVYVILIARKAYLRIHIGMNVLFMQERVGLGEEE